MARKPAYVAIAESLRNRIEDHTYKPGDRLPAERELVDEFGVARMTIRHALDLLQLEGLIDRKRGRTGGTFVRAVPPMLELTKLDEVGTQLTALEVEHSHEIVSQGLVPAQPPVAAAFSIDSGDDVFRVEIVRLISGVPAILETTYVRSEMSLQETLANELQADVEKREDVITPGVATEDERIRLGIASATQVLRVTRTTYLEDGSVAALSFLVIRPDLAHVKVVTERPGQKRPRQKRS
ncbi:GntR family transcriptional regulator [Corynebacterium cystitidis]|uniref:GntR family transcriptional regulator n=1 Tax=Corynebacterium cystitidis DSM 20524 TaxID=1121357 RepID=A0A1H9SMB8_9CORY|nr:GntR family transcriptional regulator [Corynebacterium cystitidis]WJY83104.1 HTH-type transcriptional repressor YvoA [Corynebacterium cystitidis DSM 20524]SER86170.1 GntR family transcriptional regulator [Corynebacterium cystitidis DSM 20524]SNV66291.1 transcriptional regulator [Corynebacterium cystitidis]